MGSPGKQNVVSRSRELQQHRLLKKRSEPTFSPQDELQVS